MKTQRILKKRMIFHAGLCVLLADLTLGRATSASSRVERAVEAASYADGRPAAEWRLEARDEGVVLRHGGGPENCDGLGARDVCVWQHGGTYYMHYDGAGPKAWLACLATSRDLVHWQTKGPVLDLGKAGDDDSASASYGVTYFDGRQWHMFYLGTPHVTPAPDFIPAFPYLTMKARAPSPECPWEKQPAVLPFRTRPGTYYSATASPGQVIRQGDQYLMFFSASTDHPIKRTLGLARTKDLNGPWIVAPEPIVPPEEQIENSSLFYDDETKTWFLFTNHVGVEGGLEYTDAIWAYWSRDPTRWNRDHKAVVLDRRNCKWSKHIIGLPSVVKAGTRLAIFYDGDGSATMPRGVKSHMDRDVGLAWLGLPLIPPAGDSATRSPRKGEVVYQADFEGADALSGWSGSAALEAGYRSAQAVAISARTADCSATGKPRRSSSRSGAALPPDTRTRSRSGAMTLPMSRWKTTSRRVAMTGRRWRNGPPAPSAPSILAGLSSSSPPKGATRRA